MKTIRYSVFELGADDYVTKPYSPPILLARAKRLLESRKASKKPLENEDDTLSIHGIHVHFPSRTVTVDEADVSLTHTEFEILVYFMKKSRNRFNARATHFKNLGI